jgi:hypothetical protein
MHLNLASNNGLNLMSIYTTRLNSEVLLYFNLDIKAYVIGLNLPVNTIIPDSYKKLSLGFFNSIEIVKDSLDPSKISSTRDLILKHYNSILFFDELNDQFIFKSFFQKESFNFKTLSDNMKQNLKLNENNYSICNWVEKVKIEYKDLDLLSLLNNYSKSNDLKSKNKLISYEQLYNELKGNINFIIYRIRCYICF